MLLHYQIRICSGGGGSGGCGSGGGGSSGGGSCGGGSCGGGSGGGGSSSSNSSKWKTKDIYNQKSKQKTPLKTKNRKGINELREVSILDELTRGVKVKSRILNRMKKKYQMKKLDDVTPLKETLKQKTQLKSQRIRWYENRKKINSTDRATLLQQTKRNFIENWDSHKWMLRSFPLKKK